MLNKSYIFVVIFILSFDFCTSTVHYHEHIFDESALCEFYDPSLPKDVQKFYVLNKLYKHKEEIHGKDVTLYFYPCRKKKIPNCDEKSAVCLLNYENKEESVINFGRSFKYLISDNKRRLESIDGDSCTSLENYTVTILFSCKEDISLHQKSKCNWILEMQDYTSCKQPYYTSTMDNHIINLRSLEKVKSLKITQNDKTFFLSFFKQSEECAATGASVCEIKNNGDVIPLSDISQTTAYDSKENKLIITGHHGSKSKKRTTTIHIKCNWAIEGVSNGKLLESNSPKKFNFEVESSLACIKLPLNCLITSGINLDSSLMYNISGLNKPNGGWQVANYNSGIIKINVCGPLNLNHEEISTFNVEFSQIRLEETSNGINTNLGSIPLNFEVDGYTVKGRFIEGSVCSKNANRTISTEIEFICDNRENGPKFVGYVDDCTYKLKWETPTACPVLYRKSEDDCRFSDLDLSGLHNMTDDKILELEDSSRLRYNLCGSLTQRCNQDPNVSVCWIKNDGMELPVGYTSQTLVQTDELISLNLDGDECGDYRYSTKIYFVCNYSVPLQGRVLHHQMIDQCKFEITIATPLACRKTHKKMDCAVNTDTGNFNLSSLTKFDNDYYLNDTNESNITYILNICNPITNLLCLSDSAICMVNYSNPHFHFKYKQIGIFGNTNLVVEDETLNLNYTFGDTCSFPDRYRSTINFTCFTSSDKSEGPLLVNKTNCVYEFEWKTKYACLSKTKNVSPDEKDKINVSPFNNPIVISTTTSTTKKPAFIAPSSSNINDESEKTEKPIVVTRKIHTATTKPTQPHVKILKLQNCTIKNNETNYTLNLTSLETIKIKSVHSNYSVAFNQLLSSCNGFICKNEQLIMPLLDVCPTINFNYSKSMIKLSFISQGCSNGDLFKSDIWLKCNPSNDAPSILKASSCLTEIVYPTNTACLLLQKQVVAASSTGVAIGSSIGVLLLVVFLIGGFLFFRKRHTDYFTRICYQRIPTDKANIAVYCKDTTV